MKSLVQYLQKHLAGEVAAGDDILTAFSNDASLLHRRPLGVVYARNQKDIRKTLLFLSQAAAKGYPTTLTVRGAGTDLTGAAVGEGLVLVMPAYLNDLIKTNERKNIYRVEAGYKLGQLQTFLVNRGNFLAPTYNLPATATIGGAVANNASSKYSTKYGLVEDSLQALKVVLANGEIIEVSNLSRSKVADKLSLNTFEGDIYRELERLFFDSSSPYYYKSSALFDLTSPQYKSLSAYNLNRICQPDGSLNLIPLFCGSQGTLGVVTEVEFKAQTYNPKTVNILLCCENIQICSELVAQIKTLEPAVITMINIDCFNKLKKIAPSLLNDFSKLDQGEVILIVEFDEKSDQKTYKKIRKTEMLASDFGVNYEAIRPIEAHENLDRLRSALSLIFSDSSHKMSRHIYGGFRGAYIPLNNLAKFYTQARALFKSHKLEFLAFSEIGFNHFSVLPQFDLQTAYHQRRFLKFLSSYADLVKLNGGRLSLERQEGSLLGHLLDQQLSKEDLQLLKIIKNLFDPYNILNPHLKLGATNADVSKHLQARVLWDHFHHHLARIN